MNATVFTTVRYLIRQSQQIVKNTGWRRKFSSVIPMEKRTIVSSSSSAAGLKPLSNSVTNLGLSTYTPKTRASLGYI